MSRQKDKQMLWQTLSRHSNRVPSTHKACRHIQARINRPAIAARHVEDSILPHELNVGQADQRLLFQQIDTSGGSPTLPQTIRPCLEEAWATPEWRPGKVVGR